MIRVLYILDGVMHRAGTEAFIMNYFRHIDSQMVRIDIVQCSSGIEKGMFDEEITANGSKIYYLPYKLKHPFLYRKKLCEILKSGNYKIVHGMCDATNGLVLKIAKECGIPVRIAHSHNTSTQTQNILKLMYANLNIYRIHRYANYRFACSEAAGKWLFKNDKFKVINNAIDLKTFQFSESKRERIRHDLGYQENDIVLGHVGRFSRQKNHEFLIQVFEQLHRRDLKYRLLLIGDGELKKQITEQVTRAGLKDYVTFVASIPNVADYYSAMDMFVLPSLFEGLVVVGIEAQANGLKCFFSKGTPNEVDFTKGNVSEFLPLELKVWVDRIMDFYQYHHYDFFEEIIKRGYSIDIESDKLRRFYEEKVSSI